MSVGLDQDGVATRFSINGYFLDGVVVIINRTGIKPNDQMEQLNIHPEDRGVVLKPFAKREVIFPLIGASGNTRHFGSGIPDFSVPVEVQFDGRIIHILRNEVAPRTVRCFGRKENFVRIDIIGIVGIFSVLGELTFRYDVIVPLYREDGIVFDLELIRCQILPDLKADESIVIFRPVFQIVHVYQKAILVPLKIPLALAPMKRKQEEKSDQRDKQLSHTGLPWMNLFSIILRPSKKGFLSMPIDNCM